MGYLKIVGCDQLNMSCEAACVLWFLKGPANISIDNLITFTIKSHTVRS